jgi:hypothetical protein
MPSFEIEPLEPRVWFARAAGLLEKFDAAATGGEIESALRRAFHLVQLTPLPLQLYIRSTVDEDTFERLLAGGAFETAALSLVSEPAGIRMERPEGCEMFEATVWIRGGVRNQVPTTSASAAMAILGAWLKCLNVLWQMSSREPARSRDRRDSHIFRSAQRRRRTGH